MALSEERKAEIMEEEKLRLEARKQAWQEAYVSSRWHGHGGYCGGGRRWWLHRALFWAVVIGGVVLWHGHGVCGF